MSEHGSTQPEFLRQAGRIINARQAACLLFAGNVGDVYYSSRDQDYCLLPQLLASSWSVSGRIVIVYELNGPIRFNSDQDREPPAPSLDQLAQRY